MAPSKSMQQPSSEADITRGVRRAVLIVAVANVSYFFVEFGVAIAIQSVSLFADSIDFLEDTAVNVLIFLGLGWSVAARARLGVILALVLLLPGVATLWSAWNAWRADSLPEPWALSLTGAGALLVNLMCAFILAGVRHHRGSLTRAAFLSARNDAIANVGIIGAGAMTAITLSRWPDLLVGLAIFVINLDAAREILEAARGERAALADDRP
jgi:Co/Zn/Cd efflux system component